MEIRWHFSTCGPALKSASESLFHAGTRAQGKG
jgi:hypothetical protein